MDSATLRSIINNDSSSRHLTLRSSLTPDQLRVNDLFHSCGVSLSDAKFLCVWKLINLGIPPDAVIDLLRETSKYR